MDDAVLRRSGLRCETHRGNLSEVTEACELRRFERVDLHESEGTSYLAVGPSVYVSVGFVDIKFGRLRFSNFNKKTKGST